MVGDDHLSRRQWRFMYLLLGEVRELGADQRIWRPHLLRSLSAELRADIVIGAESDISTGIHVVVPRSWADSGWEDSRRHVAWERYLACGAGFRDPFYRALLLASRGKRVSTWQRTQLVPDEHWYRDDVVREHYRASLMDHVLASQCRLPAATANDRPFTHGIVVKRRWGAPAFTRAERRLVHLLHVELAALWSREPAWPAEAAALPPRARQTFGLLLAGRSERQVAERLGISAHTAHDYVKLLHRHFGVSRRGELLAAAHRLMPRSVRLAVHDVPPDGFDTGIRQVEGILQR